MRKYFILLLIAGIALSSCSDDDAKNWKPIGSSGNAVVMTSLGGKLYIVDKENRLVMADPSAEKINWNYVTTADNITALAATDEKIYAATKQNTIWVLRPDHSAWTYIGRGDNIVAMVAVKGKLFGITEDEKIWMRDSAPEDAAWKFIGPNSRNIVALTTVGGILYASTRDKRLFKSEQSIEKDTWVQIGSTKDFVAIVGIGDRIYAIDKDELYVRPLNSFVRTYAPLN